MTSYYFQFLRVGTYFWIFGTIFLLVKTRILIWILYNKVWQTIITIGYLFFSKWVVTHSNTTEQTWRNHKHNHAQWILFSGAHDHHPKKNYFEATETLNLLCQNDHIKLEYFWKSEYFNPHANAFLLFFQIF